MSENDSAQQAYSGEDSLVFTNRLLEYGKEHFTDLVRKELSVQDFVRHASRQALLNIPPEINELFIPWKSTKYFWVCDSAPLAKYEAWLVQKKSNTVFSYDNLKDIKKLYIKWLSEKAEKESEYYALSTLQMVDRNTNPGNFLKYVFSALIYTFDDHFFSSEKALEHILKAREVLNSLEFDTESKNAFQYHLTLLEGFLGYKTDYGESTYEAFLRAEQSKQNAATCFFFLALIEVRTGESEKAISHIDRILRFDLDRLRFALNNNASHLFTFFLENAPTYEVFREESFIPLLPDIKKLIEKKTADKSAVLEKISSTLTLLKKNEYSAYIDVTAQQDIHFLEQFSAQHLGSRNAFIPMLSDILFAKMKSVVDKVKSNHKVQIMKTIQSDVGAYNDHLQAEEKRMNDLKNEIALSKDQLDQKLELRRSRLEQAISKATGEIEDKIKAIDSSKKYDPAQTFYSLVMNNFFISIIMIFVGGFISSFGDPALKKLEFVAILPRFFFSGLKWGGIFFLIGLVVCFVIAISTMYEAGKEKKRLLKKISSLQGQREKELAKLRKELEKEQSQFDKQRKDKLENATSSYDRIRTEMKEKQDTVRAEAEAKIAAFNKNLDTLFGHA